VRSAAPRVDFRLGEWLIQPSLDRISQGATVARLRPRLMDFLVFLARNAGRVVGKDEIIEAVWERRFLAESVLTRSVADLRRLLHDEAEKPRFIETVPKRGYRLMVPVFEQSGSAGRAVAHPSVAVLPFTNMTADDGEQYFCDGLAEELTNALTRLRGLRVIARTSAFAFKGKAVDVREIGRHLSVGAVIEGGVQRSEGRLRITVQLIDATDGAHLWSDRFDRRASDIFAIQDEIAQAVVAALSIKLLGEEETGLTGRRTRDLEAHDLYLRGRYVAAQRTLEAYTQAIRYFQQASARDPAYALPYAALGSCYCGCGFLGYLAPEDAFPKAKAAAAKALDLDPTLAEAHATLGWAGWAYDWDWLAAENCFRRAEELSPNDAMVRFWHALMLAALGHFEEAHVEIQRAWYLDPLSLVIQTNLGLVLFEARRYEQAIERCLKVLEMDAGFALANLHLGRAYLAMGRYAQAVAALEKAAPSFPGAMGFLGAAWAGMGRRDKALEVLRELERLSAKQYGGSVAFAVVRLALGEIDAALDSLEKAFDAREGVAALLGVEPCMDRLRSNSRFTDLLTRLRLPAQIGCGHASGI
jgi:TolB-like protein/Flp pilus assembly protein TadD